VAADAERPQVSQPAEVGCAVLHAENPLLEPFEEPLPRPRPLAVGAHEAVVAPPVALDGSRVGAARLVDDGDHLALGDQDPVRVGQGDLGVDQLLAAQDHGAGRQCGLLGHAERSPAVGAAVRVGALDVEDREVGLEGRDANRAVHDAEPGVGAEDVGPEQRPGGDVGRAPGGGPQRQGDREVGVVVDLQGERDRAFGAPTVVVAKPLGDVANPGCRHPPHAAGAHQLVEERVRDGGDQLEVTPALADDLVAGGEGDQRFQRAAHRDRHPVAHMALDGRSHGHQLGQGGACPSSLRCDPKGQFKGYCSQDMGQARPANQSGQGLIEYVLILVLVSVVVIVILLTQGQVVKNMLSNVSTALSG
jgi:pilus assembly protein Flp/PilA